MHSLDIYRNWQLRKWFIEKGVDRSELSDWIFLMQRYDKKAEEFLSQGIKNPQAVHACLNSNVSVQKALDFKKELMLKRGLDEKEAERWLTLASYNLDKVKNFSELHFLDFEFVEKFLYSLRSGDVPQRGYATLIDIQRSFELLKANVGEDVAKEEFYFFVSINSDFSFKAEDTLEMLKIAQTEGFKSLAMFYAFKNYYWAFLGKGLAKMVINHRIDFYRSLGLDPLMAEWWTVGEIELRSVGQEPDDKQIQRIIGELYRLRDIRRFFRLWRDDLQYDKEIIEKKGLSDYLDWLLQWIKNTQENDFYTRWFIINIKPEEVKRWFPFSRVFDSKTEKISKRLSIEDLEKLYNELYCGAEEILEWLSELDENEIREWAQLNVKDVISYMDLKTAGFSKEDLKEVLKYLSIEDVLRDLAEGKRVEDIKKKAWEKRVYKNTVKLFRNKIR